MSDDAIGVATIERSSIVGLSEWQTLPLVDVADISRGTSWGRENEHREPVEGALPVLGIKNVQARLETGDLIWLSGLKPSAIASSTVRTGDILMVGSNGNPDRIGNAVKVDEPGRYLFASLLFGLRPRREIVDPDFLYQAIIAPGVQTAISDAVQGTTGLSNLKITTLRDLPILLPPLDEQRRIAEALRSVDEAIASTEAELNGLRSVANAAIDERCRAAESDGCLPIGEFATFVGSGVTPKGGKKAYVEQGIAFIRSQNVHFDGLRDEGLAFIDAATDAKMARTRVQAEDVLLNITGASIGRCTIVPKDFGSANVNQHVCIIRPDPAVVLPAYLSLFLSSYDGQRQIDQLQGGLSREGLNFKQVRAITVPTPSLDVQSEIAEMVGALRATVRSLEKDLEGKQALRSGIATDLLSGRVRVPA